MPRDYKLYLNDILDAIERIENYTYNINTYDEFLEQQIVQDAVIKNLMIIDDWTNPNGFVALRFAPMRLKKFPTK